MHDGLATLSVVEGAACDMPMEWSLQVLEARMRQRYGDAARLETTPVTELAPDLGGRLLRKVLGAGSDFPAVLVDGETACVDGIDLDTVLDAIDRIA